MFSTLSEMERSFPSQVVRRLLKLVIPAQWHPPSYIQRMVLANTSAVVQAGPFKGMNYVQESFYSVLMPKWLGTYERELWACVEEAATLPFQTVIDIGAAEGYYAVGMSLKLPAARVIAYEMDPAARAVLKELIDLNGVKQRIQIEEQCTPKHLGASLRTSGLTLIICDTEGHEALLLDPLRIPELNRCYVLVELHEFVLRGISEIIRERFCNTHQILHIWQEERNRDEFPFKSPYTKLVPYSADLALSEFRPERMSWFWMRPLWTKEAQDPA